MEVIKESENSIRLKINDNGILHYDYISKKFQVAVPSNFAYFKIFLLKQIKFIWKFLSSKIPNYLKAIGESGITKFILLVLAVLTFALKWKELKELLHYLTK